MPSNKDFLETLFGRDAPWVHVTDFTFDPDHIPEDQHLIAWRGDYFSRYRMRDVSNQYFTISRFYADEKQQARRRKALYIATNVIVLDDVREKLSIDQVQRLPAPTWILETSPGSEQWGYLLDTPCADRMKVENLLDGLVANGLAPNGKDPGMKGVTRYVRLPDGYNLKAKKMVNGQPFKCRMLQWNPFNVVTLEQLAAPFAVNLTAVRREARVDGAAAVSDHPLLSIPDLVRVKEERSDGRFDITCPWVGEHTDKIDNGTAVFTNGDGSIGFKCHHGACQHRTGRDLLEHLELECPGFSGTLKSWQIQRSFQGLAPTPAAPPPPSSMQYVPPMIPSLPPMLPDVPGSNADVNSDIGKAFHILRDMQPFSQQARDTACKLLQLVDTMQVTDRIYWHNQIGDVMRWTKTEMKSIIEDLRQTWYKRSTTVNFFDEVIFIREMNNFYDRQRRIFYSAEAYQNSYADLDPEARKQALQGGMVMKVDKLDYAPLRPGVFTEAGIVYGNTWSDSGVAGQPGDISRYLEHFDVLGWGRNRNHILKFFAFTIKHPDVKINHALLFGGAEGIGKDFILYPLMLAMGENHTTIEGEELLANYNGYVMSTKHLHINEIELGDRESTKAVGAKLKPLAAAPPDTIRVNEKFLKAVKVRNILSVTATTNSQTPIRLNSVSRRYYAVWSDLKTRDEYDEMLPEWREYWEDRWAWMKGGGALAVVDYLRTQVNLLDFRPGEAPPMTEFLRDIREASKSPMQLTIEAFINKRIGCFESDIVTCADMAETIRAGVITNPNLIYADSKLFTPVKIGCIMRDISQVRKVRGRANGDDLNLWVLRDWAKYSLVETSAAMYHEYMNQMNRIKSNIKPLLAVVK